MRLPDVERPGWRKRKAIPELIAALATLIGSVVAGAKLIPERIPCPPCPQPGTWWGFGFAAVAFLGAAFAGYLKVEQTNAKDKEEEEVKGPIPLIGCLHALHGALLGLKNLAADDRTAVRITVHKVRDGGLDQLVPYVGGTGGEPGRRIGTYGVVGAAVLRKEPVSMKRSGSTADEALASYLTELTDQWFVPEEVAGSMRTDRMSFLAIPLEGLNGKVVGAVFLDSANPDFFDEVAVRCVLNSCAGIVEFVKQYGASK